MYFFSGLCVRWQTLQLRVFLLPHMPQAVIIELHVTVSPWEKIEVA